jgi:hypothetical protein
MVSLKPLIFMDSCGEKKGVHLYKLHTCPRISDYSTALTGYVGIIPLSESAGFSPQNMDENGESGQTEVRSIGANKMDHSWTTTIEECHSNTSRKFYAESRLVSVSAANMWLLFKIICLELKIF